MSCTSFTNLVSQDKSFPSYVLNTVIHCQRPYTITLIELALPSELKLLYSNDKLLENQLEKVLKKDHSMFSNSKVLPPSSFMIMYVYPSCENSS